MPPRYSKLTFSGSWTPIRRERLVRLVEMFGGAAKISDMGNASAQVMVAMRFSIVARASGDSPEVSNLLLLLVAVEFPALSEPRHLIEVARSYKPRALGIDFTVARAEDWERFDGEAVPVLAD